MQKFTSQHTSINKNKLPAVSKLIDWRIYKGEAILDYGGGKYDNFKTWLKENYKIDLKIYDPYNRTEKENKDALNLFYPLAICSNVLCIIDDDEVVKNVIRNVIKKSAVSVFTVYEGDKSGKGKITKKDCYQRNMKLYDYVKFFPSSLYVSKIITKNMIIAFKN